jgi:hypothetical protein
MNESPDRLPILNRTGENQELFIPAGWIPGLGSENNP